MNTLAAVQALNPTGAAGLPPHVPNRAGTYVTWFRAIAKKYPHKSAATILADLVRLTPGDAGKWFATAKEAKLFDEVIALAKQTPCDPRTLTRGS